MNYQEESSYLPQKNFRDFWELSRRRLINDDQEQLYKSLERGTAVLHSEKQVDKYMYAFGKKHEIKFKKMFEYVPPEIFQNPFNLVDWGCGLGLGLITLNDFCKKKYRNQQIRHITLIDPSKVAIERAKIHVNILFPNTKLLVIEKRFENIEHKDFSFNHKRYPELHLFFNVLDMPNLDLMHLCGLVKNALCQNAFFYSLRLYTGTILNKDCSTYACA
jgi:hypothetical protein